ncbi:MAG: ribosome hibernation-promoting factor, HPF/YfiA family [Eubacteriales bacterium]
MKITITGKLSEVTIQKEHIEKKLAKFDKFFQDDASAKVKVGKEPNRETIELTILSQGTIYRSEQSDTTAMNALDKCVYAIERQIRKNKTRLEKKLRQGVFVKGSDNYVPDEDMPLDDTEESYLVRTKTFRFKPMSVDEAIMQMNLLGHNFFVYVNDATGLVNVVYKRKDGNYGNITPEE